MNRLRVKVLGLGDSEVPMRKFVSMLASLIPERLLLALNRFPRIRWAIKHFVTFLTRQSLPKGTQTVVIPGGPLAGSSMTLDFSAQDRFMWMGMYEPWIHQVLKGRVRSGMSCWDLGAYIGYYALMLRRMADEGRIVAVEPDPANAMRLGRNLELNHCTDILVFQKAVGEVDGAVRFESKGMFGSVAKGGSYEVEAIRLDTLLERVGKPDLILMDVQGAEEGALKGAPRLLNEIRPTWILELHRAAGLRPYQRLLEAGYRISTPGRLDSIGQKLESHGRVHVLAEP